MKNIFWVILLIASNAFSQDNLFWKNKKPFADYWQQEVSYNIKAKISETKLKLEADLKLIYTNNSPDTLREVYFHLYQNAFNKDAYYHQMQLDNGKKPRYGLYENKGLGTKVKSIESSNKVDTVIYDNTLMKVVLTQPILPNESARFDIDFTTYWGSGSTRRRMKAYYVEGRNVHFNGVHWYPRIAVYDRKFGWNTNQHLDKEFYGDFGEFNVELDFANDYIVEATGSLWNEEEVLPKSLKDKLHISNFYHRKKGGLGDTLSMPVKREKGKRKIWKYHAENIHDFAFTADPTYRLDEREWKGKKTVAIVEERHCPKWKTAAEFAMEVIKVYSKDFGMYEYPKMVVADAQDGMEYPMLTLDTGKDPYYKGLFAHEIAHNWFYGMIGSNETYRAYLDEGFTQFLTVWSLEKIDGDIYRPYNQKGKSWYLNKFKSGPKSRDIRAYFGYLNAAVRREDPQLNTHSSDFDGGSVRHGGGYGQVYTKTAVMLFNLQYTLGDSLFIAAMQNYVREWKFKHPYPEDFRSSIVNFTKVDLNWFFDQWLETTKVIDYKVGRIKKLGNDTFEITFKRIGEMQMPIDFSVTNNYDSVINYHIPNTWFVKSTSANVLPKWYGWGKFNDVYKAKVYIPEGIFKVDIDPSKRLADINPMNNANIFDFEIKFDAQVKSFQNREKYVFKIKPDLWWNKFDGIKLGVHVKGDYLNTRHKIDAKLWMNTGVAQGEYGEDVSFNQYDDISYDLNYTDYLVNFSKNLRIKTRLALTGGIHKVNVELYKSTKNKQHKFGAFAKSLFRSSINQFNYALYPEAWNLRKANNTLNFYYEHPYKGLGGRGYYKLNYRTSAIFSYYNYDVVTFENKFKKRLNRFLLKTRTFLQAGIGESWAPESMLYLAGANPEQLNENKFTRAEGVFTKNQAQFGENMNVFHNGGGLNVRGYAGYLAPEIVDGEVVSTYKGNSGASVNLELEFDAYLGINEGKKLRKWVDIKSYAFCDAGFINIQSEGDFVFAEPRVSSGLGGAIKFKKFYHMQTVKPVTIRVDFPILLNRTPNVAPENFAYRWIIGVNRAF